MGKRNIGRKWVSEKSEATRSGNLWKGETGRSLHGKQFVREKARKHTRRFMMMNPQRCGFTFHFDYISLVERLLT